MEEIMPKIVKLFIVSLLRLSLIIQLVDSANILFVPTGDSATIRKSMHPLAEALADQNHNVTIFNEVTTIQPKLRGKSHQFLVVLEENSTKPKSQTIEEIKLQSELLWNQDVHNFADNFETWKDMVLLTEILMKHRPDIMEILKSTKWDLLIIDSMETPTGVVLAHLLETPYMLFHTSNILHVEKYFLNIPSPNSYLPGLLHKKPIINMKMSFIDRLENTWNFILDMFYHYKSDWQALAPLFSMLNIENGTLADFYRKSVMSLADYPGNLMPVEPKNSRIIHFGGRCQKFSENEENRLDIDLKNFVNDPKSKGTILIAFGHSINLADAPKQIKDAFKLAIKNLTDYNIVLQYKLENLSSDDDHLDRFYGKHVKLIDWLPQKILLNHPKTRLFITHAGVKSLSESLCAKIPMVMVPFYHDQMYNARNLEERFCGKIVRKRDVSGEYLISTTREVLDDSRYRKSISNIAAYQMDAISQPIDLALFWINFHLKYKNRSIGAFSKHTSLELNVFANFGLDIAILFSIFVLTVFVCCRYLLFRLI